MSRIRLAAGSLATVTLVAACSTSTTSTTSTSSATGASAGSPVKTLILANAVKVDNLDPGADPPVNESIWLDQMLWSRLVQPSKTGNSIVPALAKSWTISPNKLTYTFHLRDAKFSNGTPITAQDVVYSIKRSRANPRAWGFLITPVKAITAPNKNTVVFTLKKPHAPLLADLAIYSFAAVPESLVKAAGSSKPAKNPGKYFTTAPIVTSGPFYVSSYQPDSEVVLKANKYFWGPKPRVNTFKVQIIPNDNDRVLALQSGSVDIIENPAPSQWKQISANSKLKLDHFKSTRVDALLLNNTNKYLSNLKVRQAIRYALDLNTMNKLAYQGTATEASSFMPYKMQFWDSSLKPWPHNVAKAKQLMSQAGYAKGFSLNLITVSGDTIEEAEALTIQSDLKKIGINVKITPFELLTAYNNEDLPNYQMGLRYWTNDIIDPDEIVSYFASPDSSSNLPRWKNAKVPQLATQARSESDSAKRAKLYAQIQNILYTQSPWIPLLYPSFTYASGKWVTGFKASPLGDYVDSILNTVTVNQH